MPKFRTAPITAAALAIPLLLGALTACGGGDETPSDQTGSGGETESSQAFDEYQIEFAACMREQGVDMPDPKPDGSVDILADEGMMEAMEVCQDELGAPPAKPGDGPQLSEEEQRAEWVKIATCFRENGIDVPDPKPGEMPAMPMDVPDDVFEECAPNGIGGSTGLGGN